MTRLSGGLYLNVLTARPQAGVNLEVTVWDGASPGTMLAELQNASGITFQHILSDIGSGTFKIAADDPKATAANIREGNLVKIRLNDVDIFPYFIEAAQLVVAESGDTHWELAGPGALSSLVQAVVYPPAWPTPTGTERVWTSATAGLILKTVIDEAQARGALAHITYDFTATVDSQNNPWPADLQLTTHAGTTVLDVAKQLAALGVDIHMTPQLVFQAFVPGTFGRDLSTSVVWRYGRHIAGSLNLAGGVHVVGSGTKVGKTGASRAIARVAVRGSLQNAELVEGSGGKFVEVNDPASQSDPYTGRREGGLSFTSSSDPTTLQNAGNAQMAITQADANAISVPLNHGTAAGLFTPYADYAPGDWISLDVPGQYDMARFQVKGLTLAQTDGGDYTIAADLNAVALDYLVRLRNMLSSASGTASGASGGASGSLGLGAPPPSGTPLTANTPTASAPGDTGAVGVGSAAAHDDHKHGREAWGLAADVGAETFGAAAAAGASGKVADAGHVHPMPAAPSVPSAASSVTGPDAYGASAVVGMSELYARADHDHGLPASTEGLPLGLTGATAATRYVGATASGAPISGTFAVGDYIIDQSGSAWVCTVAGSPGTWTQLGAGGMANPMTTAGDLIVGDTGGTPARLAKGADSQVLTVDPTTHLLVWATPAAGSSPLTTKGDLHGFDTADARIPVGTDAYVLTADSTQALGVKWAASASGFSDPTTTKGDLIAHGTSTTRLGVGTDGQVLTADSTQALGVKWAAAGGGSGNVSAYSAVEIDGLSGSADARPASPSAYDDEFNTLSGWTTLGTVPTLNVTDFPSHLHMYSNSPGTYNVNGIYKACPALPFTVTAKVADWRSLSNYHSCGAFVAAATPGELYLIANIYNSTFPFDTIMWETWASPTSRTAWDGIRPAHFRGHYLRIAVASSTSISLYASESGLVWVPVVTGVNPGFTIGSVGLHISALDNNIPIEAAFDWIRFT